MIKLYRAKKESRKRDSKRKRMILQIGKACYHLTQEETSKFLVAGLRTLGVAIFTRRVK